MTHISTADIENVVYILCIYCWGRLTKLLYTDNAGQCPCLHILKVGWWLAFLCNHSFIHSVIQWTFRSMEREPCVFVDVFHSNPEEPCAPTSTPYPQHHIPVLPVEISCSQSVSQHQPLQNTKELHTLKVPKTMNPVLEQEEEKMNCSFEPFLSCGCDALTWWLLYLYIYLFLCIDLVSSFWGDVHAFACIGVHKRKKLFRFSHFRCMCVNCWRQGSWLQPRGETTTRWRQSSMGKGNLIFDMER